MGSGPSLSSRKSLTWARGASSEPVFRCSASRSCLRWFFSSRSSPQAASMNSARLSVLCCKGGMKQRFQSVAIVQGSYSVSLQ